MEEIGNGGESKRKGRCDAGDRIEKRGGREAESKRGEQKRIEERREVSGGDR